MALLASNINKLGRLAQTSGLTSRNISTSTPSPKPLCYTTGHIMTGQFGRSDTSPNLNFNATKRRLFSGAVSKADAAPPPMNESRHKLYAPYVYEEVKAPAGGGPLYWKTRKFLMTFKRRLLLRARERRWNWDIIRAAFAGVPKQSYDPKINQWVPLMDNEEWGGIGGRFWIQFSNTILLNFLFAYLIYFFWYRVVANNKHNAFARWKNREEEED